MGNMHDSAPLRDYSLADVRTAILCNWTPLAIAGLGVGNQPALAEAWDEIRSVEKQRAWTSMSFLTGQVFEALLKNRLVQSGLRASDLEKLMLGALIDRAERQGILSTEGFSPAGGNVVDTVKRLRNWAAHMSLGGPRTNELSATQALSILVASTAALYGPVKSHTLLRRPATRDQIKTSWREYAPSALLDDLRLSSSVGVLPVAEEELAAYYCHFVQFGSAQTISMLHRYALRYNLPIEPLRSVLVHHFVDVLKDLRWSSLRGLLRLVTSFRSLRLRPHSRVLAVMIPLDADLLPSLFTERSPHRAARYVQEVATANSDLFKMSVARLTSNPDFVKTFWDGHNGEAAFVANRLVLLAKFPSLVRKSILVRAPLDLIERWSLKGDIRKVVSTLWILYRQKGITPHERNR